MNEAFHANVFGFFGKTNVRDSIGIPLVTAQRRDSWKAEAASYQCHEASLRGEHSGKFTKYSWFFPRKLPKVSSFYCWSDWPCVFSRLEEQPSRLGIPVDAQRRERRWRKPVCWATLKGFGKISKESSQIMKNFCGKIRMPRCPQSSWFIDRLDPETMQMFVVSEFWTILIGIERWRLWIFLCSVESMCGWAACYERTGTGICHIVSIGQMLTSSPNTFASFSFKFNVYSVQSRLNSDAGMNFAEFSYQAFQAYDWFHLYKNHNCLLQVRLPLMFVTVLVCFNYCFS